MQEMSHIQMCTHIARDGVYIDKLVRYQWMCLINAIN